VNDERVVIVLPSGKKFTYSPAELVREAGEASPKPAQRSTAAKRSRSAKK
jgi:hypothetical protein